MDITNLSPEAFRQASLSQKETDFRFLDLLSKPIQSNQTVVFPGIDPGESKGDIQVVQGWKVISQTVIPIDREKLEREIKFNGYRNNNDRKAHGLHVLRHRQIEICRKRNPELTLGARIGRSFRERITREIENALFFGSRPTMCYNHNVRGGVVLYPEA